MPFQQRSRDGTHGRCTARPVTAKCRNLCIPHAILEGKRTWETYARKSTARTLKPGRLRARSCRPFLPALPKSGGLPLLTRLQNRACAFPFTRLLSGVAPVMSTINRLAWEMPFRHFIHTSVMPGSCRMHAYSYPSPPHHRSHVSVSWALPQALASWEIPPHDRAYG